MENENSQPFPNKIEVTSPKIDAISNAAETISNILHNDLKEMLGPLQHITELEELMRQLSVNVVDQFTHLFTRQLEATILSRQANVSVLQNKVNYVGKHINNKQEHLEQVVDTITERYGKLADEITKEHEFFLTELDSHAYEILEQFFPQQVRDKFSYDSLPPLDYLTRHASQTAIARTDCLRVGLHDAVRSIEGFQANRSKFYDQLDDLSIEDLEEGSYEVPYYYINTVDKATGEEMTEVVFEWDEGQKELPDDKNYLAAAAADEAYETGKKLTMSQIQKLCKTWEALDENDPLHLLKSYIESDLLNKE